MLIRIPVERHVHAFLTSSEMFGADGPVKARKDTLLGKLIIMLATKGPIGLEDYYADRFTPNVRDCVYLEVETTFPMSPRFIPEDNLAYIGEVLEILFEYQVIFFSLGYTAREGSERGAISRLYDRFGMEDDPIKQEALRAVCKRYREKVRHNSAKKKASQYGKKASQYA